MTGKRLLTALIALALLVAGAGPAVSAAAADTDGTVAPSYDHDSGDGYSWNDSYNDTEPAEDAYVTGDGDVVLVYNYTADGDVPEKNVSGHAGVNVSAGLAHVVIENETGTNVTGNLSMTAGTESASADGTLSTPRPDGLDSLEFEYVAERTDSDRASSMDLNTSVALSGEAGAMQLLQEARATGHVTTGPDSLESNGSFGIESAIGVGVDRQHHLVLTESSGTYTLDVEESFPAASVGWESQTDAKRALQDRYCPPSDRISCSISVDSFARSDDQVSLEYTATFDGVDGAVSQAVVGALPDPGTNVSAGDAEDIADRVTNVTVDRVEADLDLSGATPSFVWNVSIEGSDDLTLAYADLIEQFEGAMPGDGVAAPGGPETAMFGGPFGTGPGDLVDRIRAEVRAQKAAGYTGTTTWDVVLTTGDSVANLDATVEAETTNWGDYVTELENRDVNASGTSRTVIEAETTDDRVVVDASVSAEEENMFDRALAEYNRTLTRMSENPEKVSEAIETVRQAEFTRARMDVNLTGERVRLEGAIAVENGSALVEPLPGQLANLSTSYTSFDDLRTTVRLDGAVSEPDNETAVRDLVFVGEETTVHLPDDWDRSFDSMDVQYVRDYVGLNDGGSGDGSMPMMVVAGGAVAVTAIAGGLLVFGRSP